jgi:hypothetical protein
MDMTTDWRNPWPELQPGETFYPLLRTEPIYVAMDELRNDILRQLLGLPREPASSPVSAPVAAVSGADIGYIRDAVVRRVRA